MSKQTNEELAASLRELSAGVLKRCNGDGGAAMIVPGRMAAELEEAARRLTQRSKLRDAAQEMVEAYSRRFGGHGGRLHGPLDPYVDDLTKALN
jgi:hypothetical protein